MDEKKRIKHIKYYRTVKSRLRKFEKNHPDRDKYTAKLICDAKARLEAADAAAPMLELKADIVWSKHQGAYGYQCRAEVWVHTEKDSHHVVGPWTGGCGYDKPSTALCNALNKLPKEGRATLGRLVIEAGPEMWREYAIDATPVPRFEFGGKGLNTFTGLFKDVGRTFCPKTRFRRYLLEFSQSFLTEDYYIHIYRKDQIHV